METQQKTPAEVELHAKQFETGRGLVAGSMATALAIVLTIVGGSIEGDFAVRSLALEAMSLPLLCLHFGATLPGHEHKYDVRWGMKLATVVGFFFVIIGLGLLVANYNRHVGIGFGVVCFICIVLFSRAEDRKRGVKSPSLFGWR